MKLIMWFPIICDVIKNVKRWYICQCSKARFILNIWTDKDKSWNVFQICFYNSWLPEINATEPITDLMQHNLNI